MSGSISLHFPVNFLDKFENRFRRESCIFFKPNRISPSVLLLIEKKCTISVLTYCTCERNQECSVDFENRKGWIHFVGIGGYGLSALAKLALKQGFEVSGSDMVWSGNMNGLQEAGANLHVGHSTSNIESNDGSRFPNAVVVSSAIPQDNVEILHAKSVGVPVYKRDYWLAKITENYNLIAVSGSHGKSTTTSMLAYVLKAMGDNLTAVVGAHVPQFPDRNIIYGSGQNFVLEADEYDGCFLGLMPSIAIVTNLDWEHVDIFKDEEAVKRIFRRFLRQIRPAGHLVLCGDSGGAYSLLDQIKQGSGLEYLGTAVSDESSDLCGNHYRIITYGISSFNDWHAESVCPNTQGGSDYILCKRGCPLAKISLQIPGVHNVLNSIAMTGTIYGCHIYDDHAHHPTEVCAVLQAARQRFPDKDLLVVFEPHSYSRLVALKDDFATALGSADQVMVTAVYAGRETNKWTVSGRDLADAIIGPPSEYIPSLEDVVDRLVIQICRDPHHKIVVLTLGVGDVNTVGTELLHELQNRLRNV